MIHKWYKETVTNKMVTPFNQRTKTVDQIMNLLESVSFFFINISFSDVLKEFDLGNMLKD